MLTLFAIGTLGFWILLAVECALLLAFIENEKVGWATISLVGTLLAVHFLGGSELFGYLAANPLYVAGGVAGYFVAGTVWSVAKWWFFVRRIRDKYDDLKRDFLKSKGILKSKNVPEEHRAAWKEYLSHSYSYSSRRELYGHSFAKGAVAPTPGEHKSRILLWMAYWPWSALWTLINDPVRRAFKAIYRSIQGLLEGISKSAFRGTEEDFHEPPASPPQGTGRDVLEGQLDGQRREHPEDTLARDLGNTRGSVG